MFTVLTVIKNFFVELFLATKFAVLNYDAKLQMTKTQTQRYMIWAVILVVVFGVVFGLLTLIGNMLSQLHLPGA